MFEFVVTGFDADGALLFTLVVEAIGELDAKLVGCARMRRRPDGTALVNRAAVVKARRTVAPKHQRRSAARLSH